MVITPATQRALLMPEILSAVFDWIFEDSDGGCIERALKQGEDDDHDDGIHRTYYERHQVLFHCSLINRLWSKEAIRHLWREPFIWQHDFRTTLTSQMARLEAARRQFYANFIETSTDYSVYAEYARDDALQGVLFPKLRHLYLMLEYDHLPKIEGHKIEVLELDPHTEWMPETIYVTQDRMNDILDQIAVRFSVPILSRFSLWQPLPD